MTFCVHSWLHVHQGSLLCAFLNEIYLNFHHVYKLIYMETAVIKFLS